MAFFASRAPRGPFSQKEPPGFLQQERGVRCDLPHGEAGGPIALSILCPSPAESVSEPSAPLLSFVLTGKVSQLLCPAAETQEGAQSPSFCWTFLEKLLLLPLSGNSVLYKSGQQREDRAIYVVSCLGRVTWP